jgi:hypothetical protein
MIRILANNVSLVAHCAGVIERNIANSMRKEFEQRMHCIKIQHDLYHAQLSDTRHLDENLDIKTITRELSVKFMEFSKDGNIICATYPFFRDGELPSSFEEKFAKNSKVKDLTEWDCDTNPQLVTTCKIWARMMRNAHNEFASAVRYCYGSDKDSIPFKFELSKMDGELLICKRSDWNGSYQPLFNGFMRMKVLADFGKRK